MAPCFPHNGLTSKAFACFCGAGNPLLSGNLLWGFWMLCRHRKKAWDEHTGMMNTLRKYYSTSAKELAKLIGEDWPLKWTKAPSSFS